MEGAWSAELGAACVRGRGATEQFEDHGHGDGGADGGKVDRRLGRSGLRGRRVVLGLSQLFAAFASLGEFAIAFGVDGLVATFEHVLGCDVADGAVQSEFVILRDVFGNDASCFVEGKRDAGADAVGFDGFVPAFELAVGLGVIGRGTDMGHAGDADELLEVLGDELGPVVADDARFLAGEFFAGALHDGFHVDYLHFFADFGVDDEAAVAIEDGTKEVESAGDVEVADIDVPFLVGLQGLDIAGAFLGDGGRLPGQESGGLEDAIDAGRAASDGVGIEHHEGHSAVAVERVTTSESDDAQFFIVGEPMIAWDPGVVLVDLAEATFPVVELAGADADPADEATEGDFGLVAPGADEIDDGIAGIVGDPATLQLSPRLFFSSV
jgi:hypothetical protein